MPKGGLSSFFYGKFVVSGTGKLRRGTHLCFTDFSVSKNFRNKRGEGVSVTIFRQNGFCLTVSNYFLEEPICVSQKFLYRKILGIKGGGERVSVTIFRQNVFVSQYQIISQRKPSVFQKVSGIGKVYA